VSLLALVLIIMLVMMIFSAAFRWPYDHPYGVYPVGGLGFILLVIIILVLLGHV
jgi:hypothetical protein